LVATSPDPDDPERALREAEKKKNRERIVDERLDPYSARFSPREARTEHLAIILRQEMGVENIVRTRTWDIVKQRCGDTAYASWEHALADWRKTRVLSQGSR
jgi:predicted TIM-barrel fold metal-dependent hydrolase